MTDSKQIILDFLNHNIPILVLIGFIFVVISFISVFFLKDKNNFLINFLRKNALVLAFFSTLFSTTVSLIYSDYLGEAPCGLCWFQRIFIFSQVVIFVVAYLKNDLKIFTYAFWLSVVGGIIALYHEFLQIGFNEAIPCPVTPGLVDCAKPTFISFGFVTMPFASLTLFLFIILLSVVVSKKRSN